MRAPAILAVARGPPHQFCSDCCMTRFAVHRTWRPYIIRALQGAPYTPERVANNRKLQDAMEQAYQEVMRDPHSLLRPWAMDPERDHSLTCPTCLGVADYFEADQAFVCRRCGARTSAKGIEFLSRSVKGPIRSAS